jgi:hypothetical protein
VALAHRRKESAVQERSDIEASTSLPMVTSFTHPATIADGKLSIMPKRSAQLDQEIASFLARRQRHATKHATKRDVFDLATATEYGVRFATGVPVTFRFIRNPEQSPRLGAAFGQDIEPHGRYLLHNPTHVPPGWQSGTVTFRSPLVIALSTDPDRIYGASGWKARLVEATGKKGAALSRHLAKTYDGIVTVDGGNTAEIVDLARFRP